MPPDMCAVVDGVESSAEPPRPAASHDPDSACDGVVAAETEEKATPILAPATEDDEGPLMPCDDEPRLPVPREGVDAA